jgi:hypothetical protein
MNEKKQIFLRGDLNDFYDGKFPLRNPKYMDMLKAEYGGIFDGQKIWLFEITKKNGKYDPTIFPGIIKVINNEFEIHVNESDMMYLSESEEFKNYSIEDVIGTEWFNSIKDRYPEAL